MNLHHVGIVVDNLAEAMPLFEVWLKARKVGHIIEDEAQGARIQLFLLHENEEVLLELVEPIPGADSPIHRTGEFHLCYTVPDLDAEMARLHDLGAVVAHTPLPAKPFDNQRIGFLVTNGGQLLELLEDPSMIKQ